jgi:hypothetical protein
MFVLLQRQFNNPPNQRGDAGVQLVTALFQCGFGLVGLVLLILMLVAWQNCLTQIRKRNRTMEPGQVWLNLIPCFNLVWLIMTVLKVSESLRNEYEDRGLRGDGDYGRQMGILYYVLTLLCGPVGWIFLLIYRSKIAAYTRELTHDDRGRDRDDGDDRPSRRPDRGDDDRDDRDDDRPSRRRRAEDDR